MEEETMVSLVYRKAENGAYVKYSSRSAWSVLKGKKASVKLSAIVLC